jgi:hypothetical protein
MTGRCPIAGALHEARCVRVVGDVWAPGLTPVPEIAVLDGVSVLQTWPGVKRKAPDDGEGGRGRGRWSPRASGARSDEEVLPMTRRSRLRRVMVGWGANQPGCELRVVTRPAATMRPNASWLAPAKAPRSTTCKKVRDYM